MSMLEGEYAGRVAAGAENPRTAPHDVENLTPGDAEPAQSAAPIPDPVD